MPRWGPRSTSCGLFSPGWRTSGAEIARLDSELVRREQARSRGQAQDLISAGAVSVNGVPAKKSSMPVEDIDILTVSGDSARWVSRAATKLVAAFERWNGEGLTAGGRRCIDVGASTGGFTEVLLDRGAREVVAIDVGHGQLHPRVAADPRVREYSGTSIRGLSAETVGGVADLVVTDLSFISLTLVAAELRGLLGSGADLVALIKPQFEVGRGRLGKNGVVTRPADRARAITDVAAAFAAHGLRPRALDHSPIIGSHGNAEYLLWAVAEPSVTRAGSSSAHRQPSTAAHPSPDGVGESSTTVPSDTMGPTAIGEMARRLAETPSGGPVR